ncbi:MAG: endo-1,4-beta-xylanase [Kiritimatiellae bacterium]|nr:endo-1,4-beta-xylanase [Kiritimatiellia bacterium]
MIRRVSAALLALTALRAAAGDEPGADAAQPDALHQALVREFAAVGAARLPFGVREEQVGTAIQPGGGMERFFRDTRGAIRRGESAVEGQPFTRAFSFAIDEKPGVYWDRSFRLLNVEPVRQGESLLAVFWARGVKAPQIVDDGAGATLQAYFHSSIGSFHKGRVNNFYDCKMLGREWGRYAIKTGPLPMDFPPGTLALVGLFGHKAQTIEVGGLAVLAFPEGADLSNVAKPDWNYPGRAPDAPWREEAERRIDRFRKGELTLAVVDADGRPVPGAKVRVSQRRHVFRFGVAVRVDAFSGTDRRMTEADVARYREISTNFYNSIVIENALKWEFFESARTTGWAAVKACLDFYKRQGMGIRGHVLVWPTVYRAPLALRDAFREDPARIGPAVLAHIAEEAGEFRDWIDDWDVTNETDVNRDFMDRLGPQAMLDWYRAAREAAPDARLTFNEPGFGPAGMEIGSFPENLLGENCRGWVDYLVRSGAPLDALGSQCHGGAVAMDYAGKTGAEGLWAYYDHLAGYYGKKLQYTELDVNIGDASDPDQQAYQADMLRDSIIIAFAHPAFVGVTQWGFWAGAHYAPNAALWNRDWSIRPAGQAYVDLVTKRWRTEAELTTGEDGTCSLRAFHGEYDIAVGDGAPAPLSFPSGDLRARLVRP